MYNAKNGRLELNGGSMDYISFGAGERTLIILPGLGDALKSVRGLAQAYSVMYRTLAREYRVYIFSRKNPLPEPCTTREMARELALAMELLGLERARILGISQGGAVSQWLAIDHPERVEKLVLTVTYPRRNPTLDGVLTRWLDFAEKRDYESLFVDTAELSYSDEHLEQGRKLYGAMARVGVPRSFERFIKQAHACLEHDSYENLTKIAAPTLIIGGTEDKIVTAEASRVLHERIAGSELFMYEGLGHGLYEEACDFQARVAKFLKK